MGQKYGKCPYFLFDLIEALGRLECGVIEKFSIFCFIYLKECILLFVIMLGDGNNFNSVVRKADKQGSIFYIYPERINQPLFRLQEFCF